MPKIIDGKRRAAEIQAELKEKVEALPGKKPCLAVVLVGDHAPSRLYVNKKKKACEQIGFEARLMELPTDTEQASLEALVRELNADQDVHGILVQLPLPVHLAPLPVVELLDPRKDVDGLTCLNQGKLVKGLPGLYPCTALGVVDLLEVSGALRPGTHVAVIGQSVLVGKSVALLLERMGMTISAINSKTRDPQSLTRLADVVVVATGVHHLVDASWIKEGSVVIDVGIHRVPKSQGGFCVQGDANIASIEEKVHAYSPVPGGVGPMTIAKLLQNTLQAYYDLEGVA